MEQPANKLKRHEALLTTIMNVTDVMLVYLDPDFNFVWVNQAYADTCHMSPEDMVGKNHFVLYPDTGNEAIFRKVRDTGQPVFHKDKPFEFPDQPERGVTYWDWSLAPDLTAEGKVAGLVFSLRETTPFVWAQQSASEHELRFRSLFENMIEGYAHCEMVYKDGVPRDCIFLDTNTRFSDMTGLDDVVGKTASEVIPGIFDSSPELLETSARVASGGKTERLESFVHALNKWYLITLYSIEPGSCVAVFDDVTERRQTEAALRESERYRYLLEQQKIVQASLDGFWAVNPDNGRIVDVNDTYCKMIGYSREEILQMKVGDLDAVETPEQTRAHLDNIRKNGYDRFETRHRHKQGQLIDLEISVSHADMADINGGMNFVFLRDITERKMSVEALQLAMQHSQELAKKLAKSNERANRAIQASRLALWEYDLTSGKVYLSESWAQLLGGEPLPMTTTIDELFMLVPPEDRPTVKDALVAALKGRDSSAYHVEHRVRKLNGELMWVLSEGAVIERARNGRALRMTGTNRDITERKKLEKELLEQRNEMDALQKSQVAAQTAAAFAHELNQPLLAIASYSDAALMLINSKKPDFAKLRQAVEGSERQAQRAGKSIRELLDLLRLEEFPTEAFDLNTEIIDIMDTARSELELLFHPVLQLEDGLSPVRANRVHVRKTLFNLLHNSVEAMQQAGLPVPQITVSVRTKKDEDVAMVTIQDNGPGFRRKDFHRLFTPFYTTKPRGFGMGLSISRSLIEANGGQLWVNPEEGPGATFHLTLPFAS